MLELGLSKLPVIQPYSFLKLTWDILLLFNTVILSFYITIHIALDGSNPSEIVNPDFLALLIIMHLCEFYVSINTGFV